MEGNLERLRERLLEARAAGKTNLAEVLKEMGISPDNPDILTQLLAQAGLDPAAIGDKGKLIQLITSLSQSLSPGIKENIANLYTHLVQEMGGELPEDLKDFLGEWKEK
ncbi:hypothetical protein SAMN00808754_3088 [Thermanaeromonas toyohensis ToBE]|uniref:Uncharacterized protein n=1 Tax=Thermanaeromonas toyohensis ToBE TaxID=698762 RepID=A0A1W1W3Y3_9FIRM|nr:hypothetical protein [Thermanaeromonas toyohensis]SMB99784.1 hypothetical protein SAMN00808754_3088 [Thermanaeromonas toyohensis ToBE]